MRKAAFLSSLYPAAVFARRARLCRAYLVGTWFGEGEPYDKHQMWLEWFTADGNFRGLYRTCDKGQAHDTTQSGRWSIQGDQESIEILTVDGQAAPRTDPYARCPLTARNGSIAISAMAMSSRPSAWTTNSRCQVAKTSQLTKRSGGLLRAVDPPQRDARERACALRRAPAQRAALTTRKAGLRTHEKIVSASRPWRRGACWSSPPRPAARRR